VMAVLPSLNLDADREHPTLSAAAKPMRVENACEGRWLGETALRQFKSDHPDHFLSTLFLHSLGSPACAPAARCISGSLLTPR